MPRAKKLADGLVKRGNTYYADFQRGHRRIRKALSTDVRVATSILHELRARAEKADYGMLDNNYSLEELRTEYMEHCKQTMKPATLRRATQCLDHAMKAVRVSSVAGLNISAIVAYRNDRLRAGKSPRTVNMEVGHLSTMLRWGVRHKLIGSNPLSELRPLRHDRPKEGRALTESEVSRLLERSPQPWRDIWYAYLVTGLRKSELATLTFNDIDWQARELIIRGDRSKNHRERRVPIENGLYAILRRRADERDARQPGRGKTPKITAKVRERFTREHVFTTTENTPLDHSRSIYGAFLRCCKLAEIEVRHLDAEGREIDHLDVHSLRRTFATALIEGGADPKSVQTLLGHRTLDMTMRLYTKLRAGTTRQAIGRLAYGAGVQSPEHLLDYSSAKEARRFQ